MNASAAHKDQTMEHPTRQNILPRDINQSVHVLISISQDLLKLAEEESQSLIMLDHMRFAYAQREKEALSQRYAQASEEFRGRLGAFRIANRDLIAHLDTLQTELRDKTENNNMIIDQIKKRASANTRSTLFTVQEMGQRVSFEERIRERK